MEVDKRIALITGATDGIGKAVAARLLADGWAVAIVGRNPERCQSVVFELQAAYPNGSVLGLVGDLSSLADTKRVVEGFVARYNRLDLLLLNANAIANERIITREGHEQNLALGYFSRVLMIRLLEPLMAVTPRSHILGVVGRDTQPIDFEDLTIANQFTGRKGLCRWQWAMSVFALEYNKTSRVPMNLYMPGLVRTKILANEPQPMRAFVKLMNWLIGISPEKAADNIAAVLEQITAQSRRAVVYAWRKEQAIRVKTAPQDGERLLRMTDAILAPFLG